MRRLLLILIVLATPLQALDLATLTGQWRGEGVLSLPDQPDQRLRCDLRFSASVTAGRNFLLGRCATAQGGQSFYYRLDRTGPDTLIATRADEGANGGAGELPVTLEGLLSGDTLRLTGPDVEFALTRVGADLTFRLSAPGQDGIATATLVRRGE